MPQKNYLDIAVLPGSYDIAFFLHVRDSQSARK